MTSGHVRASYGSTTCFCWRRWTASSQDLSPNCTPSRSWVPSREMTSRLSRRRSQQTKSYCQRSVASLLNSSNCFSTRSTSVRNHIFAMSSLADQVCTIIAQHKWSNAAKSLKPRLYTHRFSRPGLRVTSEFPGRKNRLCRTTRTTCRTTRPISSYEILMGVSTPVNHPSWIAFWTNE